MYRSPFIWAGLLSFSISSVSYAQELENTNKQDSDEPQSEMVNSTLSEDNNEDAVSIAENEADHEGVSAETGIEQSATTSTSHASPFAALKELKHIKVENLKVNASAAQAEEVKDPLQPLNRQIYAFNDVLDRNIARPLAVQYVEKVPTDVRGSYRGFRKNLGEPWNAVNQIAQGRFARAAKTLGRFTINTITTLGFADPASRLGLTTEEEDFGTTLAYYGVPSGPYLMLPVLGPSTFRDSLGTVVDSQARPQKYLLDGHDRYYYSEQVLRGVDARSQLLDVESVLQGDRYAAIRDIYLQRKSFTVAEKKGEEAEVQFIDDDLDENIDKDLDENNISDAESNDQ